MANDSVKSPTNYSVWVFFQDKERHPLHFPYVKSIYYLHRYLGGYNKKGIVYPYHYMNVYVRKTGAYIGRQYYDAYIVDKPNF